MRLAPQQQRKIIKPSDNSLQLDSINQKHGRGRFILTQIVQKNILKDLFLLAHFAPPSFYSFFSRANALLT
jgi:hypothetical protein